MADVLTRNKWKNQLRDTTLDDCTGEPLPVQDDANEKRLEILQSKSLFGPCPSLSSISTTSTERYLQDSENVKKLEDETWVQCDNAECLKWRRTSLTNAEELDNEAPWFCFMNIDEDHNTCDDPEEDYRRTEHLLRKCKLRFIVSALSEGALVLARMPGYCRWPAVICANPFDGRFIVKDYDGEPLSYHVEFLGGAHSHTWICAKHVEPYKKTGDTTELFYSARQSQQLANSQSQNYSQIHSQGKKKRRRSQMFVSRVSTCHRDQRTKYKDNTVESAIEEANDWLEMDPESRLALCAFKYEPETSDSHKGSEGKEATDINRKRMGQSEKKSQNRKEGKTKTKADSGAQHKNTESKKRPNFKKNEQQHIKNKKARVAVPKSLAAVSTRRVHVEQTDIGSVRPYQLTTAELTAEPGSPQWLKGIGSLREELNKTTTMIGRSKEEKFTIDVERYRRNKDAFEHDVRRFLKRNGCVIRKLPVWRSIPVTLFEMFLAVHERGGFHQVCSDKQWLGVYRELSHSADASSGMPAKSFYEKYLLSYELYINGENFEESLPVKTPRKKRNQIESAISTNSIEDTTITSCDKEIKTEPPEVQEDSKSQGSLSAFSGASEIEKIAGEIEKFQRELEQGDSEDIPVRFFDESPRKKHTSGDQMVGDGADEFGDATLPESTKGDKARVFEPGVPLEDDGSNCSDQQVLHEMKTLQSELMWLGTDVAQCW